MRADLLAAVISAEADLRRRDTLRNTALHFLVQETTFRRLPEEAMVELAQVLLAAGCERGAYGMMGQTAREMAEGNGLALLAAALS